MTTETTTTHTPYDPHAELTQALGRLRYHNEGHKKETNQVRVLNDCLARTADEADRNTLRTLAMEHAFMADYHWQQADKDCEAAREARERCNDIDYKRAKALRAAADAADMAGEAGLATELNRRAARAEGYDPDQAATADQHADTDDAWDHPAWTAQPGDTAIPDPFDD